MQLQIIPGWLGAGECVCLPDRGNVLLLSLQVALDEAKIMGLDDALEYITDDELVEVTPQSIRIRKVRTATA